MKKTKPIKILSLDGGGVRGMIPLFILAEIEKRTGKRIADMFDMVAGNSTGGIITLLLNTPDESGKPKYSAEEVINIYQQIGPKMFNQSKIQKFFNPGSFFMEKYQSGNVFAEEAKKFFGTHTLSEAVTEVLVASYEIESSKPFFFKKWEAKKDESMNFKFSDAAQATVAAPTYFKPFVLDKTQNPLIKHYGFIDGGVVANNPALCAYVEAKSLFPNAEEYIIVSLGTGDYTAQFLLENVHFWGGAKWIKPVINIFLNGQSEIVDHQLKILFQTPGDQLKHYFRLQIRLNQDEAPFDDVSEEKYHLLELLAANTVKEYSKEIDSITQLLT